MKKTAIILALLSILVAVLPLLSMVLAGLIANLFGCNLNEGDFSVCPTVFGDIGGTLYLMAVFGWFLFYSVPLGACGVLFSIVLFVIAAVRTKKSTPPKEL